MDGFAPDRRANDPVPVHQKAVDRHALSQNRPEVDRGSSQRPSQVLGHQLRILRVVEGAADVGVQHRLEIQRPATIDPGDCHAVVDLPGAVRSQPRLLLVLQCQVQQRSRAIADVHAGTVEELRCQRREKARTLRLKRGERAGGVAIRVDLDHTGGRAGGSSTHLSALEDHHLDPGLRQLVGDRRADRAGADDDDVRAHRPDVNPRSTDGRLVDQAAQPQVFARPRLLVEGAGCHLAQAGRRWPLDDPVEAVDLAVDVAIGLENLEKGGPLTQNLLEIGTVHGWKK